MKNEVYVINIAIYVDGKYNGSYIDRVYKNREVAKEFCDKWNSENKTEFRSEVANIIKTDFYS